MDLLKQNLAGKKLLVLGASVNEITLVKRAQEYGVYVIVTDYNLDYNLSPAKKLANKAWNISWSDIDELEKKCREENIDGVIAGYSEFRVENTIKLCERLSLPCYCNYEQLEFTRDKRKFKERCIRNGVPVVKDYKTVDSVDEFPVIVKPVDRGGSIGISIAANKEELEKAYKYAMDLSVCKDVIIEKYIADCNKFDAYYEIVNGEIILAGTDDVINAKNNALKKVVQSGWILPSKYQKQFGQNVDESFRKLIIDLKIKNGYIFFSGFADGKGNFMFFECGFRLCGGHLYNYFPLVGYYDNLDLLLEYQLTGKVTKQSIKKIDERLKCLTINLYSKAGTIKELGGFDEIKKIEDCKFVLKNANVGQICKEDEAILSKLGMVYFCSNSNEILLKDTDLLYSYFYARDSYGNDLVYDRIEQSELKKFLV